MRLVSASDKLHNARAILADYRQLKEKLWKRFNVGKDEHLWYYRELVKVFRRKGPRSLAVELEFVVTELKVLTDDE